MVLNLGEFLWLWDGLISIVVGLGEILWLSIWVNFCGYGLVCTFVVVILGEYLLL